MPVCVGCIMTTLNANIYYCISCCRVVHVEIQAEPPRSGGHLINKAFQGTTREGTLPENKRDGHSKSTPPVSIPAYPGEGLCGFSRI